MDHGSRTGGLRPRRGQRWSGGPVRRCGRRPRRRPEDPQRAELGAAVPRASPVGLVLRARRLVSVHRATARGSSRAGALRGAESAARSCRCSPTWNWPAVRWPWTAPHPRRSPAGVPTPRTGYARSQGPQPPPRAGSSIRRTTTGVGLRRTAGHTKCSATQQPSSTHRGRPGSAADDGLGLLARWNRRTHRRRLRRFSDPARSGEPGQHGSGRVPHASGGGGRRGHRLRHGSPDGSRQPTEHASCGCSMCCADTTVRERDRRSWTPSSAPSPVSCGSPGRIRAPTASIGATASCQMGPRGRTSVPAACGCCTGSDSRCPLWWKQWSVAGTGDHGLRGWHPRGFKTFAGIPSPRARPMIR